MKLSFLCFQGTLWNVISPTSNKWFLLRILFVIDKKSRRKQHKFAYFLTLYAAIGALSIKAIQFPERKNTDARKAGARCSGWTNYRVVS
jgi:hypothetical protein